MAPSLRALVVCCLALSASGIWPFGRRTTALAKKVRSLERDTLEFESNERILLEQLRQMRLTTGELRTTLRESIAESERVAAENAAAVAKLENEVATLREKLAAAEQRAAAAEASAAKAADAESSLAAAKAEAARLKKELARTGELKTAKAPRPRPHEGSGRPVGREEDGFNNGRGGGAAADAAAVRCGPVFLCLPFERVVSDGVPTARVGGVWRHPYAIAATRHTLSSRRGDSGVRTGGSGVHKKRQENLPYGAPHVREEHLVGPPSSRPLDDRPLFQARRPPLHRFSLGRRPLHLRDRSISIGRRIERSITSDAGRPELRFPEERHIRPDRIVLRQADPQTKLQPLIEASTRRFGHVVVRRVELRRGLVQPLAEGP